MLLALLAPNYGSRFIVSLERHIRLVATRRRLAVFAVLATALIARLAVLPIEPIPEPGIHDEFSYLLMADTFAHGRLTNPPHPMWKHFETFHVNQLPTYCSKYMPAQGLFLALGQAICHQPFWGVWLSTGLMCASICWALQAWMPPTWALVGGILAILRLGVFSYWADSYWGGSVSALGGALVVGAFARVRRRTRVRDSAIMATGLSLLAASRPYEGLVYSIPILVLLSVWLWRSEGPTLRQRLCKFVLPAFLTLMVTASALAFYFWRTTGSPWHPPYAIYAATYDAAPFVPWQRITSVPIYRHEEMKRFYLGYEMNQYLVTRSVPWFVWTIRTGEFWLFFAGPALMVAVLVAVWLLPYGLGVKGFTRKARVLLLINLVSFVALLLPTYFNLHYAAPMTCSFLALLVLCFRSIWIRDRQGVQKGKSIVRGIILVCIIVSVLRAFIPNAYWAPSNGSFPTPKQTERAKILKRLREYTASQIVIVRYKPDHDPHDEWVYNDADIDGSRVIWARDMGPQNAELVRYFHDRRPWLLEPDYNPPKLSPYEQ